MCTIQPCNQEGNNAIKGVAFAVEFQNELTDEQLNNAKKVYSSTTLKSLLPRENDIEQIVVQIQGSTVNSNQNLKKTGVVFDKLSLNGDIEWALVLNTKAVIVQCNMYTRWNNVWTKVNDLFQLILPVLQDSVVNKIGVEYLDIFFINDIENGWAKNLFKQDSIYISNNIFNIQNSLLWHSHHGYFSNRYNDELVLNRLNIDFLKKEEQNCVEIRAHHSVEKSPKKFQEYFNDEVIQNDMTYFHQENKNIFKSLLTDEILRNINLY